MPSNLEVELRELLEEIEKTLPSMVWRIVPPTNSEPIIDLKVYSGEAGGWTVNVARSKNYLEAAASNLPKHTIVHLTTEMAQKAFEFAQRGPTQS